MTAVQMFKKGDQEELKFFNSSSPVLSDLELSRDEFFNNCYTCFVLGEVIFDGNFSPLVNAVPRDIFRKTFADIFDSFVVAGSFESYLSVFRKVFGASVDVTFTVPAPGKLQIDIIADTLVLETFIARRIEGNQYIFDDIIDDQSETIVFQAVEGLESQYELEQMLFEMVPAGIFTDINLTIGGP